MPLKSGSKDRPVGSGLITAFFQPSGTLSRSGSQASVPSTSSPAARSRPPAATPPPQPQASTSKIPAAPRPPLPAEVGALGNAESSEKPSSASINGQGKTAGSDHLQQAAKASTPTTTTVPAASSSAQIAVTPSREAHQKTGTFFKSPRLEQFSRGGTDGTTSSSSISMKRTISTTSSSSLSSVPDSPPKKKTRAANKMQVDGRSSGLSDVDGEDESEEEEEGEEEQIIVQAKPKPSLTAVKPPSRGQKFVGVVIPRVPTKKLKSSSPRLRSHSPVRRPVASTSAPIPEGDDSDELEDADELLAKLVRASKPSPKKKTVSFSDAIGADRSMSSPDEDLHVRRSVRVVEKPTRPERAKKAVGKKPSTYESASDQAGRFSLAAMTKAVQKEEKAERLFQAAVEYELPDEVPQDLLQSPSRRDMPTTPPPQSQDAYPELSTTPFASPTRTRIQASDLKALDNLAKIVGTADGLGADEQEIVARKNLAKKTAQLVRGDHHAGDKEAEKEMESKLARSCWLPFGAGGEESPGLMTMLEQIATPDQPSRVVAFAIEEAIEDHILPALDLLSGPSSAAAARVVLRTAFHPATPTSLADRLMRVILVADQSIEANEVASEVVLALESVGYKDLEAEDAEEGRTTPVKVEQRQGVVKRIGRVVEHVALRRVPFPRFLESPVDVNRSLTPDNSLKLLPHLIHIALDPTVGAYRVPVVAAVRAIIAKLLEEASAGDDTANPALDAMLDVADGQSLKFHAEMTRLIAGDTEEARSFKSWVALAGLRAKLPEFIDPLEPPSILQVFDAVIKKRAKRPTYRRVFDAQKADDRELGHAVWLLQTAIGDLDSRLDRAGAMDQETIDTWRALVRSLEMLDGSIRTSIRGDPERYKTKNTITRLRHRLDYDLKGLVGSEDPIQAGSACSPIGSRSPWAYDGSMGPLRQPGSSRASREQSAAAGSASGASPRLQQSPSAAPIAGPSNPS